MNRFIKLVIAVLLAAPICIWLNPPWYATFSIGAIVSMIVEIILSDVIIIRTKQ